MPDYVVLLGLGGLFILIGIGAIFWGRNEEKGYYDALSTHRGDVREFLEHRPHYPQFVALKIGGWISIAVGVVMAALGGGLWLWG